MAEITVSKFRTIWGHHMRQRQNFGGLRKSAREKLDPLFDEVKKAFKLHFGISSIEDIKDNQRFPMDTPITGEALKTFQLWVAELDKLDSKIGYLKWAGFTN